MNTLFQARAASEWIHKARYVGALPQRTQTNTLEEAILCRA